MTLAAKSPQMGLIQPANAESNILQQGLDTRWSPEEATRLKLTEMNLAENSP